LINSISDVYSQCQAVIAEVEKAIIGKKTLIAQILAACLAGGHILLEDFPGLGKTILAKSLASALGLEFKRIQFTPDLLPGDITGSYIYDRSTNEFVLRRGPVFSQIILADEINRATPRTQSALLEAMQEKQVTIDGFTHMLPRPFLVMATQNPIELEGTFPLPEAQIDRFLMRIAIGYPDEGEENQILERFRYSDPMSDVQPVSTPEEIIELQMERRQVRVAEAVREYIVRVARATRNHSEIELGASPRATLSLYQAAQAWAAIQGRDFTLPDDVKKIAPLVLTHRLIISPQAQLRGRMMEELVADIVEAVPVPVEG